MDDFGFDDAMLMGAGYAMYRHGQDRQTEALMHALGQITSYEQASEPAVEVGSVLVVDDETVDRRGQMPVVNAIDNSTLQVPESWDEFIGQERLKRQLLVHIAYAQSTRTPLPHVLLASGMPGVGKTTLSRMIAQALDAHIVEVVPPFNIYTLVEAAEELVDGDVLFIDEIHKLAQSGKRGAEILLKVLEDHTAYLPNGEVVHLPKITVIGATTDRDMLPEPVVDRFKIKPHFEPYSDDEMQLITFQMGVRHECHEMLLDDDMRLTAWIARAARRTPRIAEEIVLGARALSAAYGGVYPEPGQVLDFVDVQPDGLSRAHVDYLVTLFTRFGRMPNGSRKLEYIAGEATLQSVLRETKPGMARLERFLMELGYVERTPRGRMLTPLGIERASELAADSTPSASIG